jgi:chemotaxis methyl-accepting protein methylase/PAS domain-containing protein
MATHTNFDSQVVDLADTLIKRNIFPIIGIGASAGGLEALELFLSHVPASSGMAFIVIQHLDPHHRSVLPELLQRITSMTVFEVTGRIKIRPNCVYVNPPNKDLMVSQGVLHLVDIADSRGPHMAIDSFFQSLAEDCHENAIGVILSGMGADGTQGLRAIKAQGGLTLVQEPGSAKFDSMPNSAITAKLADVIATAEELPARLLHSLPRIPCFALSAELAIESKSRLSLESIITLLRARTGNDFSLYKKTTLYRRIERRMSVHQIQTMSVYVSFLTENPQEVDLLFKELLIGVTNFFRDSVVWEYLKTQALPPLLRESPQGKEFRAWIPACSTGEEAYSLAIVFTEAVEQAKLQGKITLKIFATDIDHDAITKARLGLYPASIADHVSPERLARYFVAEDNGYRVCQEIREKVIFTSHNIIRDAPFTKLDLLSCRNLMIYLGQELQNILLPLFHYSLNSHGMLLLGSAETIGSFSQLFVPTESKVRLFRRVNSPTPLTTLSLSSKYAFSSNSTSTEKIKTMPSSSSSNLQHLVDQLLLKHYTPAAVLINAAGDILYINGSTGKYLEPATGKANWNIRVMAREGLRFPLVNAIQNAVQNQSLVLLENVKIGLSDDSQRVNITVQALKQPDALSGKVMIVFANITHSSASDAVTAVDSTASVDYSWVWDELQQARANLQTLREDMQLSQEELQSTNEELQSTNEELTTSKEEMQSMNEELQTVNAELQSKVDDLSWVNNDMTNLLNSTEIATIFLDNSFRLRRFTPNTTRLFKLLPQDVGRPLSDIVSELDYPDLLKDASGVLNTLVFSEKPISTNDDCWFTVRIMPYRTQDNVINGVVITFSDITVAKKLEIQLHKALQEQAESANKLHQGIATLASE